jgi:hypothetical protein
MFDFVNHECTTLRLKDASVAFLDDLPQKK